MATPTWLAATPGQPTKAGQVNQLLGAHAATLVYPGVVQAQQNTAGSGAINSNSLWTAQSFTTGGAQTAIGRVILTLAKTGSPPPITLSIQATSSGHPSGTALASTLIPAEFVGASAGPQTFPVPVSGLTAATTYWIVLNADGDPSNFFSWSKSNQTSGASTSANGTTWTAQTYGLLYQEFDATTGGSLVHTWEDNGARWSLIAYNALLQATSLWEHTAGQTATGYLASTRTLTYTSGQLTGIS